MSAFHVLEHVRLQQLYFIASLHVRMKMNIFMLWYICYVMFELEMTIGNMAATTHFMLHAHTHPLSHLTAAE